MFIDDFDPAWWDLNSCNHDELPDEVVVFLPEDSFSDDDASSVSSDDVRDLGGCWLQESNSADCFSYHQPSFHFSMFRSPTVSDSERLAQIDEEMGKIEPYRYKLREALREKKSKIHKRLKGKQPLNPLSPHTEKVVTSPGFYTPAELYTVHPDNHKDKHSFRRDKETLLILQIKEKQNALRNIAAEIGEIKRLLDISIREKDQSSDEELEKVYATAVGTKLPDDEKEGDPEECPDVFGQLGQLSGPRFFIKISLCPPKNKPYELDCIVDSGAQMSLAKYGAIPNFYWELSSEVGNSIDGTPVNLLGIVHNFPISI